MFGDVGGRVRPGHTHFECGAGFLESARMAEGLKELIEEDLSFTLFVARDVFGAPGGEFGEFVPARHGGVLHERRRGGNSEGVGYHARVGVRPLGSHRGK